MFSSLEKFFEWFSSLFYVEYEDQAKCGVEYDMEEVACHNNGTHQQAEYSE